MPGAVTRTVLFADVSGSTQLYESVGDEAAAQAIAQCIRAFSDATRLAGKAAKGQVLTAEETARLLSPALRSCTRVLYSVELKGKAESVSLCEFVWRQGPDITVTDIAGATSTETAGKLWLKHRDAEVAHAPPLRIGRDKDCEIVVSNENAS